MKKLAKKIIKKRKVTPFIAVQLAAKVLGVGGLVLLLGGGALGFKLGAERVKRRWNLAP